MRSLRRRPTRVQLLWLVAAAFAVGLVVAQVVR
jgi:hypothetical protein